MKTFSQVSTGKILAYPNTGRIQQDLSVGFIKQALNLDTTGGGGIPADAVLYEDGSQVFYEDAVYLNYVA